MIAVFIIGLVPFIAACMSKADPDCTTSAPGSDPAPAPTVAPAG